MINWLSDINVLHPGVGQTFDRVVFPEEGDEQELLALLDLGAARDLMMMSCGLPAATAIRSVDRDFNVAEAQRAWNPAMAEARPFILDLLARLRRDHPASPRQRHVSGILAYISWLEGDTAKATSHVNEVDLGERTRLLSLVDTVLTVGMDSPYLAPKGWNDFASVEESVPVLVAYSSGTEAQRTIDEITQSGNRETIRNMVLNGPTDSVPIRHMISARHGLTEQGYSSRSVGSFTLSINSEQRKIQLHRQLLVPGEGAKAYLEPRTRAWQTQQHSQSLSPKPNPTERRPYRQQDLGQRGLYR